MVLVGGNQEQNLRRLLSLQAGERLPAWPSVLRTGVGRGRGGRSDLHSIQSPSSALSPFLLFIGELNHH